MIDIILLLAEISDFSSEVVIHFPKKKEAL